jgi:hypothetical protein
MYCQTVPLKYSVGVDIKERFEAHKHYKCIQSFAVVRGDSHCWSWKFIEPLLIEAVEIDEPYTILPLSKHACHDRPMVEGGDYIYKMLLEIGAGTIYTSTNTDYRFARGLFKTGPQHIVLQEDLMKDCIFDGMKIIDHVPVYIANCMRQCVMLSHKI